MKSKLLAPLLIFSALCSASSPGFSDSRPWLTGPLLTPSSRIVKAGHFLFEPYWYLTFINGRYLDNWSVQKIPTVTQVNPILLIKVGMTEKMGFTAAIQGVLNTTQNRSSVSFGDLPIGFEFELYNDSKNFLKFTLQELFPIGKFQKLEPGKFGTDAGGLGSFTTLASITFGKLIHLYDVHYLSLRFNVVGGYGAPTHVKGFNAYGGDPTTQGVIFVGPLLQTFIGLEYTLTENWALALDIVGQWAGSDRFKGVTVVPTGFPPSVNLSIAPAIEYNFNENIGLIAGSWITLAGKNSNSFTSFATAINIYY